jgi:hypothetical protein
MLPVALMVSWDEVDRLLDEKEFAAAVLVTAINVESVLIELTKKFCLFPKSKIKISVRCMEILA